MSSLSYRKGAVSIFVVVFTALLITIVTVSFVRLMVRDQQRASDNDLSKSAYDSAMVGVEDAKRALARYYAMPAGTRPTSLSSCNGITELLTGVASPDEVKVRTTASAADEQLNQAYTCVKVDMVTDDYERPMAADQTVLVPLQTPIVPATGQPAPFTHVRIQWFVETDPEGNPLDVPTSASSELSETWPDGRPPVIETQFMQTSSTFTLDQFDGQAGPDQNTNTLFLYPKRAAEPTVSFNSDVRKDPKTRVTDAGCATDFSDRYLCAATVQVPVPVGGADASSRNNAYLRITPRYRGAWVQVTMYNAASTPVVSQANLVQFNGVQPRVDSTGRANDLFRRTEVRIESGMNAVYPVAAVDVSGSFCKTFLVTDQDSDYVRGDCAP